MPPEFTRTGSYYRSRVKETEYWYLQASDVRRQVQQAPAKANSRGRYPVKYGNEPYQSLSAQQLFTEFPIMRSPQNGLAPTNYANGQKPGPIRAFYNEGDRMVFDVGYHDPARASECKQVEGQDEKTPFSLA
ncbi:hypothetical protein M7I_3891 [Glarea lozoyensis 74030]|nr:hypothetical protein M7I_3891 [Glarea lozoyensis 74030]